MIFSQRQIVDPDSPGYFHCVPDACTARAPIRDIHRWKVNEGR